MSNPDAEGGPGGDSKAEVAKTSDCCGKLSSVTFKKISRSAEVLTNCVLRMRRKHETGESISLSEVCGVVNDLVEVIESEPGTETSAVSAKRTMSAGVLVDAIISSGSKDRRSMIDAIMAASGEAEPVLVIRKQRRTQNT